MKTIKVFTAFSGYDSQMMALNKVADRHKGEIDFELVGWSEIDKYAIKAHDLIFPQYKDRNYGDISLIDWNKVPDFDLFTYSSPCQDWSNAGLQRGGQEGSGTRSSLLWECRKAIIAKKPKYLLLENVKALVGKKFIPYFNKWCFELGEYGYYNYWRVMNAKDYGVPQNRERVFLLSIRKDIDNSDFIFPKEFELTTCLKDVLEEAVDEKYYLSEKSIKGFLAHNENHEKKGTLQFMRKKKYYGVSRSRDKKGKIVKRELKDYIMCVHASVGGGRETMWVLVAEVYEANDTECAIRGRSNGDWHNSEHKQRLEIGGEISNSITSVLKDNYIFETNNHFMEEKKEKAPRPEGKGWCWDEKNGKWFRIRKLTPRECFRLMDVTDADFDKLLVIETTGKDNKPKRVISDSQLYKMAGNSIVVSCMYLIFENLFFPKKRIDLLF